MARVRNTQTAPSVSAGARLCAVLAALACALLAGGCSTGHPPPLGATALAEAETFPYYPIYWVGHTFGSYPLTAVDGQKGYSPTIGDSVYYGDCVRQPSVLGGGSCMLPLQVTTVIYRLHSNKTLGPQRNTVIRGVPAVVYDEGRSIELYSGRQAIDVFSDTLVHAMRAARALRTLNAPGSAVGALPGPVYCPGLYGAQSPRVRAAMDSLPHHACQHARAVEALNRRLSSK
jgi:hypothetical protein